MSFLVSSKVHAVEEWPIRRMLAVLGNLPIHVVLWDGREIAASEAPPAARLFIHDRSTLLKLFFNPDLNFGEAYSSQQIEVEGLLEFLEIVYRARQSAEKPLGLVRGRLARWLNRRHSNTMAGARANIHDHYDIGNDFYRLWLDDEMVYSCAYFPTPEVTLEQAQLAKMDYVCRKLRLRPGESVVDVGGGWGAMALYMARHYGVRVTALNVSHEQTVAARERAKAEGLHSQVEFVEDDYRNISGRFDALVSLGMLEHVGADHYREFGRMIDGCLDPAGRGLIQTIGQDRPDEDNPWITRRIFPGGHFPSTCELMKIFEHSGFSVLDVENLRLHYAKTLEHWLSRFESAAEEVARMFDERFVRIWRLYLTGSRAAFSSSALQLFQVLFARPGINQLPWTRAPLYT